MIPRSGGCLCGAVRFAVSELPAGLHACHCESCRRSSGSASLTAVIPFAAMRLDRAETVSSYQSSDWASRSFCARCGSSLWYRLNGPDSDYYLSAGLLDDLSGLRLTEEIFIDCKPEAWAFAGQHDRLTEAEFEARLSANPEE